MFLEEKIEVLKERPGRQARDVRELGFALIRRCHSGETGWIRRCYLESVFKEFQKSESYVGDEEPNAKGGCVGGLKRKVLVLNGPNRPKATPQSAHWGPPSQ